MITTVILAGLSITAFAEDSGGMVDLKKLDISDFKDIFEEKTGVRLDGRKPFRPFKTVLVTAALVICCLGTTVFAADLFSSLSGDDLAISAVYEGDGIISNLKWGIFKIPKKLLQGDIRVKDSSLLLGFRIRSSRYSIIRRMNYECIRISKRKYKFANI